MGNRSEMGRAYIEGLGGASNIEYVEACSTRVRVIVKGLELVCEQDILNLGAFRVIQKGERELHIVLGMTSEMLVETIKRILND